MTAKIENNLLTYSGSNYLKQRLVLATLSGKAVQIKNIRSEHDAPGLRDYEASLIRLLDKITNGTKIEITESGTTLYYRPGLLDGGSVQHNCNVERGIGKFCNFAHSMTTHDKYKLFFVSSP